MRETGNGEREATHFFTSSADSRVAPVTEAALLELITAFVSERHGQAPRTPITGRTRLEQDLGLFSLERHELARRIDALADQAARILRDGVERGSPSAKAETVTATSMADAETVQQLIALSSGGAFEPFGVTADASPPAEEERPPDPPRSLLFTASVALLLGMIGLVLWPVLRARPGAAPARRALRRAARALLRAARCPLSIAGVTHLDGNRPAMIVANHQSYADSVVLIAVLPIDATLVVNERLPAAPLLGTAIRAAGYLMVDRSTATGRARATPAMADALRRGETLAVFPEGTIGYGPRLEPFRLGAFAAAASSGRPVIPVTIAGTRRILPLSTWRLARGPIVVTIHPPIVPEKDDWSEGLRLARIAARVIDD